MQSPRVPGAKGTANPSWFLDEPPCPHAALAWTYRVPFASQVRHYVGHLAHENEPDLVIAVGHQEVHKVADAVTRPVPLLMYTVSYHESDVCVWKHGLF
jgi:hypothetical protein